MRVRHGREGSKDVHGEEEHASEREAGGSRRERHRVPDLRVLLCERHARAARRVREVGMVSVWKREGHLRWAGGCERG
jgi:hypothetical protein